MKQVTLCKPLISTFVLALMMGLGACTKSAKNDGVVRMRLATDPPTLDWAKATDNVSKEVINPLQDGLLGQTPDSKVEPSLAESWTVDPKGLVYEFRIRDNAKWSDGVPVTAQHFVDAWERLLNAATASEYAYFLFDVKGAEEYQSGKSKDFAAVGVRATAEKVLRVELKHAASYWMHVPAFWATYPIRKDLIEKYGDKWTLPGNLVTTGPYVLKEWQRESRIVLEKNPHFYNLEGVKDAPERVEFRTVKEGAIAVTLFRNKEIDIVRDLPPIQVPTLAKGPGFKSFNQLRGYYIGFNIKDAQVKDVNIRRAIAKSIDRAELGKVLTGMVEPTKTWIPEGLVGYNAALGIDYDPAGAQELWAKVKNKPKNIEIWFDANERNKIVAENVQSQVKKVLGLDLVIQIQEWKVYLKTLSSNTPPFFRLGWGADYPDADNFMNLFKCNSGNNFTKLCDKNYDTWVSQAAAAQDNGVRQGFYDKAQKLLIEDEIAFIPLFTEKALFLVSDRVQGFEVNSMNDFSFKRIKVKKDE